MESDVPDRAAKRDRNRILANLSFCLFVYFFLAAIPSLRVPGKRWPDFAFAAVFAILPLCCGARWLRWAGVAGLLLCSLAIVNDIQEGRAYEARMLQVIHDYEQQHPSAPATQDGTNGIRLFKPNTNF